MCRRLRTTIPTVYSQPKPYVPDYDLKEEESKKKQKAQFDSRHRAQDLDPLSPGDVVWILAAFGETSVT